MNYDLTTMFAGGRNEGAQTDQMMKALTDGLPVPTYTGGGTVAPLLRQDLTQELIRQVFLAEDLKLFASIYQPREKAKNTVFEYTRQTSRGPKGPMTSWQPEGDLSDERIATFVRTSAKARTVSHSRTITFVAEETEILGPDPSIVAEATGDAIVDVGSQIEMALFNGDDSVDENSINGLKRVATDDGQVIDCRNGFDPDVISQYAVLMREGEALGKANQCWSSFAVKRAIGAVVADSVRRLQGLSPQAGKFNAGTIADSVDTDVGKIPLMPSIFLSPERYKMSALTALGANPPATPVLTSVTPGAAGGATSYFAAADAGTYYYVVAAVGKGANGYYGAAFVKSSVTTVAAGEKVTITITAPSEDDTLFYVVYRTAKGTSTPWWPIAQVAQTYDSPGVPGATVVVDLNAEIPGRSDAYLIENTPQSIRWREVVGFSRVQIPLPRLAHLFAFYQVGCPMFTKRNTYIRFKNIAT